MLARVTLIGVIFLVVSKNAAVLRFKLSRVFWLPCTDMSVGFRDNVCPDQSPDCKTFSESDFVSKCVSYPDPYSSTD
jgi:hypothetical protein